MTSNNSKHSIDEWLEKAEGDFRIACREAAVKEDPNYDGVCFHAQQCIEKYLKAFMVRYHLDPPRTHDLIALIQLLILYQAKMTQWLNDEIAEINLGAVEIRYPGAFMSQEDALAQLETCKQF